jgi:hypothetical protein
MIAACPACGKRYEYTFGDFGCSAACRFDWTTGRAAEPPTPTLFVGDRVRIATGWDPLDGKTGVVYSRCDRGGYTVLLDEDQRPLRFGPGALEVLP